jgi:hypothetical protein
VTSTGILRRSQGTVVVVRRGLRALLRVRLLRCRGAQFAGPGHSLMQLRMNLEFLSERNSGGVDR